MLDIYNELKLEHILAGETVKILRTNEHRCSRRAQRTRINYPIWKERQSIFQSERADASCMARYIGLVRAMFKGMPYSMVENAVREGNEVNPSLLEAMKNEMIPDFYTCMMPSAEEWLAA